MSRKGSDRINGDWINGLVISPTYTWLVYWGYNPLILTFDPNFQRDIQVPFGMEGPELFRFGALQKGIGTQYLRDMRCRSKGPPHPKGFTTIFPMKQVCFFAGLPDMG